MHRCARNRAIARTAEAARGESHARQARPAGQKLAALGVRTCRTGTRRRALGSAHAILRHLARRAQFRGFHAQGWNRVRQELAEQVILCRNGRDTLIHVCIVGVAVVLTANERNKRRNTNEKCNSHQWNSVSEIINTNCQLSNEMRISNIRNFNSIADQNVALQQRLSRAAAEPVGQRSDINICHNIVNSSSSIIINNIGIISRKRGASSTLRQQAPQATAARQRQQQCGSERCCHGNAVQRPRGRAPPGQSD